MKTFTNMKRQNQNQKICSVFVQISEVTDRNQLMKKKIHFLSVNACQHRMTDKESTSLTFKNVQLGSCLLKGSLQDWVEVLLNASLGDSRISSDQVLVFQWFPSHKSFVLPSKSKKHGCIWRLWCGIPSEDQLSTLISEEWPEIVLNSNRIIDSSRIKRKDVNQTKYSTEKVDRNKQILKVITFSDLPTLHFQGRFQHGWWMTWHETSKEGGRTLGWISLSGLFVG